ncbi:MAG: response regulator [Porphyrobacter sp.]|nr:response regulator [Porphyrobacter sp.]
MKVRLVESENQYSSWLVDKLVQAGFRMEVSHAADIARGQTAPGHVSATIFDMRSAGPPPSMLVRRLRDRGEPSPIMVISEADSWRERVDSLDAGADDFIVKPVRSEEVCARLRALVRRTAGQTSDRLSSDGLEFSLRQNIATLHGEPLDLTHNELRLLRHLLLWPDRTHSAEEIGAILHQTHRANSINAVEVMVARLRKKIGHERIRTIRRVGYRLERLGEGDQEHREIARRA